MAENTKDKTYYAIVTAAGEVNFISGDTEKRRYMSGVFAAAKACGATVKMLEYHACSIYLIIKAKNTKTVQDIICTANHSYGSFLSMKSGRLYSNLRFKSVCPICLSNAMHEEMIKRGLYLSMRF